MNTFPRLIFPDEFDERALFDAEQGGVVFCTLVELENGDKYEVEFYTTQRLAYELSSNQKKGLHCFAEPGLIIVSQITMESMSNAVSELHSNGYFQKLMPLAD